MDLNYSALLFFVLLQISSQAQTAYDFLDGNDVRMRIFSNGLIGVDHLLNDQAVEVPAGAGTHTVYSSGLWLGGTDQNNVHKLAAHLYGSNGHDFYPGPLSIDGNASIPPSVVQLYDQVWKVNAAEITMHAAYHQCLNDAACNAALMFPGYTPPAAITNWPAEGDQDGAQAAYLAPFMDMDQNGSYDPMAGDLPCTPGDQAMFMIFNDSGGPHMETGGQPLGVEVHMLAFAYAGEPHLDRTVFLHYKIINRSANTLSDFRITSFADLDIGCASDDFIGTDVQRNMVFGYNASDIDADCLGATGYGMNPPAHGIAILKGPRIDPNGQDDAADDTLPAYNGSGFGDGIVDNERHGLSNSMYFNREGNPAMVDPANLAHFDHYMNSRWLNGLPLAYGGIGYSEAPSAVPSRYAFPGDSDPVGAGTNGEPQPAWTETVLNPVQPDRRVLATMGPITLEPGAEQEILLAHVYARAGSGGAMASVAALKQRVDSIRAFAETIPGIMAPGSMCDPALAGVGIMEHSIKPLRLYPSPASDIIRVDLDGANGGVIQIFDGRGALVREERLMGSKAVVGVNDLVPGIYHVRLLGNGDIKAGRFLKE